LTKGISLYELKHEWSYPDLLKANALLDMEEDYKNVYNGFVESDRGKK